MTIRLMRPGDIPAGLGLCRASRWNQTEADWRAFLGSEPSGAIVASEADCVVGTAATFPYGPFTWISMVLVDPASRGRGVGTSLLEQVLTLVPSGSVARLDATPLGEPIYRKLGFTPEYALTRWVREAGSPHPLPATDPSLAAFSLDSELLRLDREVFGASRAGLLDRLAAEAPELAWIRREEGALRGYALGRPGHVRQHIGPIVADTADTATRLLDAGLAAVGDGPVLVDAPDAQTAFREALVARGFTAERPFLRMSRGVLGSPGDPSRLFAITGPEFG